MIPYYQIFERGLINDGVWEYDMQSSNSYIRYGYEPYTNVFYLYNIATPIKEDQNKGYAKLLLEEFFFNINMDGGVLDPGSFTISGMNYIKPLIERFSNKYNVRLINYSIRKDKNL